MYYTDLDLYASYVADVLDSMGLEEYTFDIPTWGEVQDAGRGFLYVEIVVRHRDYDEVEYELERKLNRVLGPAEVTITDLYGEMTVQILFESIVDYS